MSEFYAVILADSYDDYFNHLTKTFPKVIDILTHRVYSLL